MLVVVRLSAAAASTLEELKTQGRSGLVHAIGQRKVCVCVYHCVEGKNVDTWPQTEQIYLSAPNA